ncbi:MAG: hypothetical protein IPH35_07280 [Rhodoferax sp.]|nr:hypothetical protein [Rhodoferax sp.]
MSISSIGSSNATANSQKTNTPTANAGAASGSASFKEIFGEIPTNLNRSGLSGIVDARGNNLSNEQILSFFEQNPSMEQIQSTAAALGLSQAQVAQAEAIALGKGAMQRATTSSSSKTVAKAAATPTAPSTVTPTATANMGSAATSTVATLLTGGVTSKFGPETFKAIFGDLPAGLDRSGLSGIIDGQGNNLSRAEIITFFDKNPTTGQIEEFGLEKGLNQFQLANATAIARGASYKEPIWAPPGASTIGGQNGSGIDFNGRSIPASGAWGNNAGNTRTNLAGYNTTGAQQAASNSSVNFQA